MEHFETFRRERNVSGAEAWMVEDEDIGPVAWDVADHMFKRKAVQQLS